MSGSSSSVSSIATPSRWCSEGEALSSVETSVTEIYVKRVILRDLFLRYTVTIIIDFTWFVLSFYVNVLIIFRVFIFILRKCFDYFTCFEISFYVIWIFHFTCFEFSFDVFWIFIWRQWCPFYVCSQVRKRTKFCRFNVFLISFYVVFDVFKFGILIVFLEAIGCCCCCCHILWHMKWLCIWKWLIIKLQQGFWLAFFHEKVNH